MSVNFEDPMNKEARAMLKKLFGEPVAQDEFKQLFNNRMEKIQQQEMKKLANAAGQPVTVELNSIGDRKDVGGIVYELDEVGWRKLPIGTVIKKKEQGQ